MADVEAVVCGKAGCRVAETGKCLEGLPVDQCPHRVPKGETQPSDAQREAVSQGTHKCNSEGTGSSSWRVAQSSWGGFAFTDQGLPCHRLDWPQ